METITKIKGILKKVNIKKIIKNINTPSYENFIYISYFYLVATIILLPIFYFITNKYNIECNELLFNIYLALSTLMIPLAIFIAQKISDSKETLIANVYMNQSHIFPMTIFQIISFVSLFYIQNYIYYFVLIIIYAICIVLVYIKTLRLFSDSIYFAKKLKKETQKIINEALDIHIDSVQKITKNESLPEYGIYFENYHYEDTNLYSKEYIYPPDDNLLIKELNERELGNLKHVMQQINIGNVSLNETKNETSINKKDIIVFLQNEGYTTRLKMPIIRIFYNPNSNEVYNKLNTIRLILNNLYKYEDYNFDVIVKKEIQEVENKCAISICNHSITELKNNLRTYIDFFKAIVDNINCNIEKDYSLNQAYKSIHSLSRFKGFKYFEHIRQEIFNLCYHPNALENKLIFNELTSCIYEMLLYSYTQYELISFEYISNMYQNLSYIVNKSEKLDMDKIQLELFEILNYIYYDLKNAKSQNYQTAKNMIILLNKVIVNIMFDLASTDIERYHMFRNKFQKFISALEQEIKRTVNPQYIIEVLQEILMHYSSNLYAMDAYLFEKNKSEVGNEIINFYSKKSFKYIISAFLNTHKLDFDSIYHWEDWEKYDILNEEGAHFVKTGSYINNLFCNICIKQENIELPVDRDLVSFYNSSLKNIFDSLGYNESSNLILKFEEMLKKYNENGKRYLRETHISKNKETEFKNNFMSCYIKENNLYNLMKKYNNIEIVKPKSGEKNYLGISQILEKTFLLEEMPNNENIIFSGFESGFTECFINGEEKRYVKDILKKLPDLKSDILDALNSIENIDEIIIFANYSFNYKLHSKVDFKYEYSNKYKSIDENNNLYIIYKDYLIPVYSIQGLDNNSFYIINKNRMGKFCRDKDTDFFNIEIFEYSNNEKHLQKTMNEKINGCTLEGEEKRKHLLESVNLVIREYVKFQDNGLKGYKLFYKE